MVTTRLDIRLDEQTKVKAEKAAAILGLKSSTEYLVSLINEDADRVIAEDETMTLKNNVFDDFMAACEQAKAPNQALRNAVACTQEQGFT